MKKYLILSLASISYYASGQAVITTVTNTVLVVPPLVLNPSATSNALNSISLCLSNIVTIPTSNLTGHVRSINIHVNNDGSSVTTIVTK